jgi:hypothetical protein
MLLREKYLFRHDIFPIKTFSINNELIFAIIIPKIYVTNISVKIKNQLGSKDNVSSPKTSLNGIEKI